MFDQEVLKYVCSVVVIFYVDVIMCVLKHVHVAATRQPMVSPESSDSEKGNISDSTGEKTNCK